MEIEEILRELEFSTESLPRDALEAAIAQREAITPHLLRFIEHACEVGEHLDDNADETGYYDGHINAMYLLAEFRETAAYPLIVRFFSIPGEFSVEATGDVVTQDLDSLLASVCGGDMGPIKGMVENPALSEWARGAALRSFLCLVAAGEMPREEAIAYYAELFRGRLEREGSNVWDSLVAGAADLCADELREEIDKAFNGHLVDPYFMRREEVEDDFARGKEQVREHLKELRYGLIESAIQSMEWWDRFRDEDEAAAQLAPPLEDEEDAEDEAAYPWEEEPVLPVRVEQTPGRNDPCPCGSGKKYKRCCERKGRDSAAPPVEP